jgi:hypothetical protein
MKKGKKNTSPYRERIKNVEQILKLDFSFDTAYKLLITDSSETFDSAIVKEALECPKETTCFIWAAIYHNISTVLSELDVGIYSAGGDWTNEINRPLLCEM